MRYACPCCLDDSKASRKSQGFCVYPCLFYFESKKARDSIMVEIFLSFFLLLRDVYIKEFLNKSGISPIDHLSVAVLLSLCMLIRKSWTSEMTCCLDSLALVLVD